jgi:hypothetical protein
MRKQPTHSKAHLIQSHHTNGFKSRSHQNDGHELHKKMVKRRLYKRFTRLLRLVVFYRTKKAAQSQRQCVKKTQAKIQKTTPFIKCKICPQFRYCLREAKRLVAHLFRGRWQPTMEEKQKPGPKGTIWSITDFPLLQKPHPLRIRCFVQFFFLVNKWVAKKVTVVLYSCCCSFMTSRMRASPCECCWQTRRPYLRQQSGQPGWADRYQSWSW